MDKSYLSSRTNNLINNQINGKNLFELEYVDGFNIKIKPVTFQDGLKFGRVWHNGKGYNFSNDVIMNIPKNLKDNVGLHYSRFYFLYANINILKKEITEFFLVKQHIAQSTSVATFTKGDNVVVYLTNDADNNAYQFEAGARVIVWRSEDYIGSATERNNLATIVSINSYNSITIKLDNNANYGASFVGDTGIIYIVQIDKFIPKKYNSSTNKFEKYCKNFSLLTAGIYFNEDLGDAGEIQPFSYKNGTYTGLRYSVFSLSGVSSPATAYDRYIYPFYCVPPTATAISCKMRYQLLHQEVYDSYCTLEASFSDKNTSLLYNQSVGNRTGDLSVHYYDIIASHIHIQELLFRYSEWLLMVGANKADVRQCSIYSYTEDI